MERGLSPQLEAVIATVEEHLVSGKLAEAESILREAEAMAGNADERSVLWALLGHTCSELGRYEEAEPLLYRAIAVSPYGSRDAALDLTVLYEVTDRPWNALAAGLEALAMSGPDMGAFYVTQLDMIANLYVKLHRVDYALPHYRSALRMLQSISPPDRETKRAIARRLQEAEQGSMQYSAEEPHATALLDQLRVMEFGHPEFVQCLDQLSDLHHTEGANWLSLLCSLQCLAASPDTVVWNKHQRRAGELWATFDNLEFSLLHYRELAIAVAAEEGQAQFRSLIFEMAEAWKPLYMTEADLIETLKQLPDGPAGELLLDVVYDLYRKSK